MARAERNPLRKRLAALRRRLRLVVTLRGAGWLLTLLLVSAGLAGFLDWAWRLPALVRAAVLVGTLSGAGLLAYRLLLRPLLTRVDDLTLALRIEERYPSLNDALASTVQFLEQAENRDRREAGRPPMVVSPAMRLEAVRRALGKATGCDFNRIIDTRGLRTAGLTGVAASVAIAVLAWLYPALAATALARLADPFGAHDWPKATQLELEATRQRIGRNEAFEVRGRLHGVIPDKAYVVYRLDGGGQVEHECKVMKGTPGSGSLEARFPPGKLPRSFRFQVRANDAVSPWRRVEVAPPPKLALLDGKPSPQLRLFYPRYTGLEPMSLPDGNGNVTATTGTLVTLRAAANVPLKAAWVEFQSDGSAAPAALAALGAPNLPALLTAGAATLDAVAPRYATLSKDRRSFFLRFVPPARERYTLHLEDDTGLRSAPIYTLNITPDPAPTVTLERPSATKESLEVLPSATLPLRALAEDPVFGLRSVWLEYRLQPEGSPRRLPLFSPANEAAPAAGPLLGLAHRMVPAPFKPQQIAIDRPLPLSLLRRPDGSPLREGDVVALKVCADDHDDVTPDKKPGCSVEVEIRIVSRPALDLALSRDQARIQQELTEIRQQQREAIQKVTDVENRVARTKRLTPEDLLELDRAEQMQQQIRERIDTSNQESVRSRVQRILDTLKQNGIERSAIRERLEPVRNRLDRLGREELRQIEAKLNGVRKQGELPEEGRKERRAETLEKDAEAAAERAKKLDELAREGAENASQKARLEEDAKKLRQQADRLRELAKGLREEMRTPPKDPQAAAAERARELERLAEERRRQAAELEKSAARDSTGHDREKLKLARDLKKSAEALRQEAQAAADAARAGDKAGMKSELTDARRRQEEVEKTLSEMLKDLEPWSSTREVKSESRALLEEQRKLNNAIKAMQDQLGEKPDQLSPEQKARLDSAAAAQQKLAERTQQLMEKMKLLAEERKKQGDSKTAEELKAALDASIASSMKEARDRLHQNQLGNAGEEQQRALAGLEKLVKNLEDRREAELGRLNDQLRKAEADLEKLAEEQDQLRKKIKEAANEKDPKKREEELKRLARKQRELQQQAEQLSKQLSRLRAERAGQSVAQAAKQMEEAVRRLERGEAGDDKQDEALDRLDEAQEDLEAARAANEEELAREALAKVADVLKRLKERQDALVAEEERIRKEVLERKGWSRGQRISLRNLGTAQEGLGHECKSLADRDLTAAPIFARLLRKAAESMQQAAEEFARHFDKVGDNPEDKSAPATAERKQKLAQHRLQQILDALKIDEGTPIRAANNGKPAGGSQGRRAVGDGIPPLAQLKLLRAIQAEINERTKEFAAKHPDEKKLTAEEKRQLEVIRREQREVAELIEEYTQKPLPGDRE